MENLANPRDCPGAVCHLASSVFILIVSLVVIVITAMVLGCPHAHLLASHQLHNQLPPLKLFSAHGEEMKREIKHPSFQVSFGAQIEVKQDRIEHIST